MKSLVELIRVNTNYTRAINIERDSEQAAQVRPYVVTARASKTLERIAGTLKCEDTPRAWALIGPYGAGKSAFGLFLSNLLGNPDSAGARYASRCLKSTDTQLYFAFQRQRRGRGFCCITLTGSPEPLANSLLRAMLCGAEAFFGGRAGRAPKVIEDLRGAVARGNIAISDVVALLAKLQENVSRAGGRGVLIVIDELGKFLEYEARHRRACRGSS